MLMQQRAKGLYEQLTILSNVVRATADWLSSPGCKLSVISIWACARPLRASYSWYIYITGIISKPIYSKQAVVMAGSMCVRGRTMLLR